MKTIHTKRKSGHKDYVVCHMRVCYVERSRCSHNVSGIVIRGGYFWKDTKMFMEYTGSVRTALDSRRDEYAEIMEKVKYVPVFVDVIRVIDNLLYKKEDC